MTARAPTIAEEVGWPLSPPIRHGVLNHRLILNTKENRELTFRENLRSSFDGECLSKPLTSCTYKVSVSPKGLPLIQRLNARFANDADKFYCDQAIWESFPYSTKYLPLKDTVVFDKATNSGFPELVSNNSSILKLHFVPSSILKLTWVPLNMDDIRAPANVSYLSAKTLDRKQLDNFRKDWTVFIKQNPRLERQQLLDFVRRMRETYRSLFLP